VSPVQNSNKNILLVIKHPVGGIRTYIKYIYSYDYFKQYNITILLTESSLSDLFIDSLKSLDFNFVLAGNSNIELAKTVFNIISKNKYDLVHSHGFTSALCASLIVRLFNIRHIMTVHDVLLDKQFQGINGYFKRAILPFIYNRTDVIHAVSHDVERNICDFLPGINNNKLITITNGINIQQFKNKSARDFHKEYNFKNNTVLFGFFGRFMSQKGFIYIIRAVEILYLHYKDDLNLKVIAIGSDGFIREDREIINNKNLQDYFIFLPPENDISRSLNGLDAVLMPSLWEACGLIAMETLVAGVPLIATNCIGLREVINNTPTITVDPADDQALANAMEYCMTHSLKEKFREYSHIASKRFDSENTAKSLSELYKQYLRS